MKFVKHKDKMAKDLTFGDIIEFWENMPSTKTATDHPEPDFMCVARVDFGWDDFVKVWAFTSTEPFTIEVQAAQPIATYQKIEDDLSSGQKVPNE